MPSFLWYEYEYICRGFIYLYGISIKYHVVLTFHPDHLYCIAYSCVRLNRQII